ncbi:hypothetical protein [Methanocella arvoryzae]|uniref:hypothetical protein n=1 Tax=Methanocella arvoryzae TaxID=1175445 RepID=UPI0000DB220D|nr:hypothetical protein [Methanocella arvoryzae]
MPGDWDFFKSKLFTSISEINDSYYHVKRAESVDCYKERVYCYELYHQLRIQLGDDYEYCLMGELDKCSHQSFCNAYGVEPKHGPKPDFIIHTPGIQNEISNFVIIEIKTTNNRISKIKDDIIKLLGFINNTSYRYGISLIYGDNLDMDSLNSAIAELETHNNMSKIMVIWHDREGCIPRIVYESNSTI